MGNNPAIGIDDVREVFAVATEDGQARFDFDFPVYAADQVLVALNGTVKTLNTQYTVDGLEMTSGGTITFVPAVAAIIEAGDVVLMQGLSPAARDSFYQQTGDFRSYAVNRDLDRLIMHIQELKRGQSRRLRWPLSVNLDNTTSSILPAWQSGYQLTYNTDAGHKAIIARNLGSVSLAVPGDESVTAAKLAAPVAHATRSFLNVFVEGAVDDPTADNRGAFEDAFDKADDYGPWAAVTVPGKLGVKGDIFWENKHRSRIIGPGSIIAADGFVGDTVLHMLNSDPDDDLQPSMGMQTRTHALSIDGRYKARTFLADGIYDSYLDLELYRSKGCAFRITRAQEVHVGRLFIDGAQKRANPAIVGATAWNAGGTYVPGDVIFRDFAAWAGGTTYAAMDKVRRSGFLWYSLESGNVGNTPGSTDKWIKLPEYYFIAQSGATGANLNKDPAHLSTDYTTRAADATKRFWLPTYADEAAMEFVPGALGSTLDNMKFDATEIRSCDMNELCRIDGIFSSIPPSKLEFSMVQAHHITQQYLDAFNDTGNPRFAANRLLYGGTIATPDNPINFHIANAFAPRGIGGQARGATLDDARGILLGTIGCSGNVPHYGFPGFLIDMGTALGDRQVNFAVLESVALTKSQGDPTGLILINTSPDGHEVVDIKGETILEQNGDITLPAGDSSVPVVFDPPLNSTPEELEILPSGGLRGMQFFVTGLTKDGFTLNVSGRYLGPELRPANLDGAPAKTFVITTANQTAEWTHSFGIQHDGIEMGQPDADVGATFRTLDIGSTVNKVVLKAPVAPDAAVILPFTPFWRDQIPVDFDFTYHARVIP